MLMAGARYDGLDLSEQQLIDCGYEYDYEYGLEHLNCHQTELFKSKLK